MRELTCRERILRQLAGELPDRLPLLGGWTEGAANLAALAGWSAEQYRADALGGTLAAHRALGVDGLVHPIVPSPDGGPRTAGAVLDEAHAGTGPEALSERAAQVPDTEAEVLAGFDTPRVAAWLRAFLERDLAALGELVLVPTFWGHHTVPKFGLYDEFGYEAFLLAVALDPAAVGRLYWADAVRVRAFNELLVGLYRELDLVPWLFTGDDICNNAGPLCSPEFLRRSYFPAERYALEPLVDAGIRLVRHCDGNVMPLIDDFLAAGYSGFQGFQYECGVEPATWAGRRGPGGEPLIWFAGLNVTRTLPLGDLDDIAAEIDYVLGFTGGGRGLFFFPSSSIGPEVEPAKTAIAYRRAAAVSLPAVTARRAWPWAERAR